MDYCNGTTHHWSDDTYSQGNYPCPGWPRCQSTAARMKYDDKEAPMEDPNGTRAATDAIVDNLTRNPSVALTVSIPVKIGGYTGQCDAWEEYERSYAVSVDGDKVILSSPDDIRRKISFDRDGLKAALEILAKYDADAKPKPVMRGD